MRFDWLIGISNAEEPPRGDTPARLPSVNSTLSEAISEGGSKKVRCQFPMLWITVDLMKGYIMPMAGVEHDRYGRLARVKPRSSKDKDRDSDTRSTISSISTSSRKHRDSSSSSSRTTLPQDYSSQASQGVTQTPNPDQLPKLPESGSSSPSTASSPRSRTHSTVSESTSTALTSSASLRTPASLQPYLEDYNDSVDKVEESQATPKPEKPKRRSIIEGEPSKSLAQLTDETASNSSQTSSCDTVKVTPARSPARVEPPLLSKQKQSPKDSHRLEPKYSDNMSVVNRSSTPASVQKYPYGSMPPGPPGPPDQYYPYLQQMPAGAGPLSIPQNVLPQAMPYYPDFGIPPLAPAPPQHLQYPPQPMDRSRDEHAMALLQRVDRAIPDLHLLMNSYQENYAMLEASETQIRNMEAERAAESQTADARFAKVEKDIKALLDRHSAEKKTMNLEINTMETKRKELERKLKIEEKDNDELNELNQLLRNERKDLEKKYREEKAALTKGFSLEKDKMVADHRTNQRDVHDQLQGTIRKLEANHAYQVADLKRGHEEEKQHIEGKWGKHWRELEDRHNKSQRELESILEAKQMVVDEERRSFLQAKEGWDRDRENLTRIWDEERTVLHKTSEEQRKTLTIKYQREKDDLMKQFSQSQGKTENHDTILQLQREIDFLKSGWEADRFKFHKATTEFKTTARTFNDQNSRLQKLTESFDEGVEAKSKRDSLR